jgi:hypothetical protein
MTSTGPQKHQTRYSFYHEHTAFLSQRSSQCLDKSNGYGQEICIPNTYEVHQHLLTVEDIVRYGIRVY